jgi:hypothetical protein
MPLSGVAGAVAKSAVRTPQRHRRDRAVEHRACRDDQRTRTRNIIDARLRCRAPMNAEMRAFCHRLRANFALGTECVQRGDENLPRVPLIRNRGGWAGSLVPRSARLEPNIAGAVLAPARGVHRSGHPAQPEPRRSKKAVDRRVRAKVVSSRVPPSPAS